MRIIYRQIPGGHILLEYANTRDAVYELYEQILANRKNRRLLKRGTGGSPNTVRLAD